MQTEDMDDFEDLCDNLIYENKSKLTKSSASKEESIVIKGKQVNLYELQM